MTIKITVDHWPFVVEFEGTIEIARQEHRPAQEPPCLPVFIRKVSTDAAVLSVILDQEHIDESHKYMRAMIEPRAGF